MRIFDNYTYLKSHIIGFDKIANSKKILLIFKVMHQNLRPIVGFILLAKYFSFL